MVEEEEPEVQFKARELNKKIMNCVSPLPEVERKELTSFSEFNLSNNLRGDDKENPAQEVYDTSFKARDVDRKILQDATFKPDLSSCQKKVVTHPFNFETDKRVSRKEPKDNMSCSSFKATPVPNYKFFELAKKSGK